MDVLFLFRVHFQVALALFGGIIFAKSQSVFLLTLSCVSIVHCVYSSTEMHETMNDSVSEIYIGGLFDIETPEGKLQTEGRKPWYGRSEQIAAMVAMKHINDMNYLGGVQLRILFNDSKVSFLHDFITAFDVINLFREVSIEHLQRLQLANRGRLLPQTTDPVLFGTCICSNVETIHS